MPRIDLGDIQVRLLDDALQIWNPDRLPEGIRLEQLRVPSHPSSLRNRSSPGPFTPPASSSGGARQRLGKTNGVRAQQNERMDGDSLASPQLVGGCSGGRMWGAHAPPAHGLTKGSTGSQWAQKGFAEAGPTVGGRQRPARLDGRR